MASARILLVDDATETRNFLAESVLAPEGYEVYTAASGMEAIELIHNIQPDLIISDYLMPKITGLDLLKNLKNEGIHLPFILITAEGSEALAVQALRLGVKDYLIKPFDIGDLLDTISKVLEENPTTNTNPIDTFLQGSINPILITNSHHGILYMNAIFQQLFITQTENSILQATENEDLLALFSEGETKKTRREITLDDDRILNADLTTLDDGTHIIIMQEITQLKELDQRKSEFVATVSHDLRSPLTTILGYVDLLKRAGDLNKAQNSYTEHIIFSVKSITALLTDLLDLSKIEAGYDTGFEPLHMNMILRYAIEAQRGELDAKGHILNLQIEDSLPQVLGNPLRLKQVALNLIQNAIKYTDDQGEVEVSLYHDGGFVVLQVKDNGIGISAEEQNLVWNKFYRTESAKRSFVGTGLGLSIVKSIIDAHGGRIWVESTPQQGSTFTVMLAGVHE